MIGPLLLGAAAASPGTEFVLVLDNSCSMVEEHVEHGEKRQPADPDRHATVGALIVEGLARGTDDRVTVLAFPKRASTGVVRITDAAGIRDLQPAHGTTYAGPLRVAREILDASTRDDRMLLFLSDGEPTDLREPAQGRALLGMPPVGTDTSAVVFDTLVLGLLPLDNARAEAFLQPLARTPEDYVRVQDGATLVSHFTRGYARALGSRALTGTLSPGAERAVDVGRYVDEVLVVTAGVQRTGPYTAVLAGPSGPVRPKATGDNGCSQPPRKNPGYCDAPRIHHAVWRVPHDATKADRWTVRLEDGGGDVAWGVILRYALQARADVPPAGKVGTPTPIRASLLHGGTPVDDPAFFEQHGFTASARVDGQDVPLTHVGGGVFEGSWVPTRGGDADVVVRFQNDWMEEKARGRVAVEQPPPLSIEAPPLLDFGHWRGERTRTSRCLPLSVTSNHPYDPSRLAFTFDVPDDVVMSVTPVAGGLNACVTAYGCCGDLKAPESALITIRATDTEGSTATARMRVAYEVDRTGFLRCWWPWLLALAILLVVLWFLYGWIRPHDFDEDLTVKVAGSERQLARAASLVLREQPKGRRGFYRNARVALTATGDFVANPRNAALWIEATGRSETTIHLNGPLEIRDRRTKKWAPLTPEQAADGVRTHEIYRLNDLYLRFQ